MVVGSGGVGGGEVAADAPPQGGGGVVVGQGSLGGGVLDQGAGVDAGGGELGEPVGEGGVEVVADQGGRDLQEQGFPFGERAAGFAGEALLEVALPGGEGGGDLSRSGGPAVAGFGVRGGPPYLDRGDRVAGGRHPLRRPPRQAVRRQRLPLDDVGELGDEVAARGEVRPPRRVLGERCREAG